MTDKYCVIGNPIAHSKSPDIHAAFAAATGEKISYGRCEAPINGFEDTVRELIAQGYRGANVTVPFKLDAAGLATTLKPRARLAGAVNTLHFKGDEIIGDNTDGPGLVADIERNARVPLAGKRILMLGAGGAARGVILPFLNAKPKSIVIANRTRATADELVDHFSSQVKRHGQLRACGFDEIEGSFDIVVNATSASLSAAMPPVPASAFRKGTLALDMMYGKKLSPFLLFAKAHGATVRDGLGMLVEQAAEAFYVWRDVRPQTQTVLAAMRERL